MPWGMQSAPAGDYNDIVKYDAKAGRLFRIDRDVSGNRVSVDITMPAPTVAIDFGALQVGYASFAGARPDFRMVSEGQALPVQPMDRADKDGKPGPLLFKAAFKVNLYGKILGGIREFASTAVIVNQSLEELYAKFLAAPEAVQGKIPVIQLTRTMPIAMGRPPNVQTNYAPCFAIVGWTDRVPAMGERTVPPPRAAPSTTPTTAAPAGQPAQPHSDDLNDEIPF